MIFAIMAVQEPDWEKKIFHVSLTKEQVRNCPDVDAEKPVSRQQEIAMRDYWGWTASWVDRELGWASTPNGVKYPLHTEEEPHLRSAMRLIGYPVCATVAEMGSLAGFILDEENWRIGYLDVKGGD